MAHRLLTLTGLGLMVACADADPPPAAPAPPQAEPLAPKVARATAALETFQYPASREAGRGDAGPVLADILSHLPPRYGQTYHDDDPITHGHETSHGIHSDLRNQHRPVGGDRVNGFYLLEGRAAIVPEPPGRKSAAQAYIPAGLRGPRYALYVAGSPSWDDTPTYLWDEWNAYVNGTAVGVDQVAAGRWGRGWRDGAMGTLEFGVYAVAVARAVQAEHPEWYAAHPQFAAFLKVNLERGMALYRQAAALPDFAWADQDAYLARLLGDEGEPTRAWVAAEFGEAYAQAVFTGAEVPEPEPPAEPQPPAEPDPGVQPGAPGEQPPVQPRAADADGDGVADARDLCRASPAGAPVWRSGAWMGCAEGQRRDPPAVQGPDADGDAVADADDLCRATPAGARVWREGEWRGCAEGQFRDREL